MAALLIGLAALAATASAAPSADSSCCFHVTGSSPGGPAGTVGQLSDGQNRLNQTNLPTPQGDYCIANGSLTDQAGRGCILTSTSQWQCDEGKAPTTGFGVSSTGALTYNGNTTFWSCPTSDNGGWNIYRIPVANQAKCVPVWLQSDNPQCYAAAPTTSSTPASTPSPTATACPYTLSGDWEFPHLIVPVSSQNPDTAYGTVLNGTAWSNASQSVSSFFNFDIPTSYAGKTCTVTFAWPTQSQLETSAYTIYGDSSSVPLEFSHSNGTVTKLTTYNNAPTPETAYESISAAPGNAYTVAEIDCPAGQVATFEMSALSGGINYFQDYNPCPIGLYLIAA